MAWWNRHGRKRTPVAMIFRWRRPHRLSFRLFFFLFASIVLHLAAFYLFEVVYPPNKKDLVRDATLWLLPMDDPDVRAVLAVHAESLRVFTGGGGGLLEQAAPVIPLRYSFQEYESRFEPLAPRELSAPLTFPDAVPVVLPGLESITDIGPYAGTESTAPPATSAPLQWLAPTGESVAMEWPAGMVERLGGVKAGRVWEFQVAYDRTGCVREAVLVNGCGGWIDTVARRETLGLAVPGELPRPAGESLLWARLRIGF